MSDICQNVEIVDFKNILNTFLMPVVEACFFVFLTSLSILFQLI